uniref:Uncharacterized protein n=1 Tax=Schistocephalus solidus TaxID=70667 RepID=A0A0X3Q0Z4_SCHSO
MISFILSTRRSWLIKFPISLPCITTLLDFETLAVGCRQFSRSHLSSFLPLPRLHTSLVAPEHLIHSFRRLLLPVCSHPHYYYLFFVSFVVRHGPACTRSPHLFESIATWPSPPTQPLC